MEGPRVVLLIVLFIFIFLTPDQPAVRFHTQKEKDRLAIEKQQDFNSLANSTYGDLVSGGLNLTGFRPDDGYQLQLFPVAQELSRRQHVDAWYGFDRQTPVYHDIDGEIKGSFVRVDAALDPERKVNLTEIDPGADYLVHYERNITDNNGQVTIGLEAIDPYAKYLAREIKASVSIYTKSSPGYGWDAKLRGIHYPSGEVVLTTSSRKFNALPALPHLTLSESDFLRATPIMNSTLTRIWKSIDAGRTDETPILAAPKCELVIWLQQRPQVGNRFYIDEIEQELMHPDGAPVGRPPPLAYSAVVFSPDCGYILQADTVFGPKVAAYSQLIRRITAAFCLIMIGQIFLLKRQMEKCATPSTRSRVSYHTFGIAAFGDGLVLFAIIGIVVVDLSVFLLAGAAAFLCCIHVAFLEVKFIFDIWTVQVGDPINAERERQRRTTTNTTTTAITTAAAAPTTNAAPATTNPTTQPTPPTPPPTQTPTPAPAPPPPTNDTGLPLPATAPNTAATTTTLPLDQDPPLSARASFASLYSRFYFALVNLVFFSLWASSWPPTPKHIYFNTLAFAWFSLWLPQIHRNTVRNCRKALSWEYVLGTTALRAIPVLYWYVDERNVLSTATSGTTAVALLGWLGAQIGVLVAQQFLGPRKFVPEGWCPPAYEYHPVLYDDLEAGGLPIGEVTSASEGKDKDVGEGVGEKDRALVGGARKVFDCAICMNEIDVPVVSKDEKMAKGGRNTTSMWLEQRNYMVTPCRHIFHSECLEGWMNLRLVCPVCREGLPPL